jgi:hypothetical protein
MAFLEWLQGTWVGLLVAESLWGYPLLETIHSIGMAMMIGSLGLINLRVLGFKPDLPLLGTRELLPLAWLGFTLNAVSGTLLFTSDAVYFFSKYTFRIKMVLIILGGLNAALLGRRVFREASAAGVPAPAPTASTKWVAVTSLLFWLGAVCAGRLIAYAP